MVEGGREVLSPGRGKRPRGRPGLLLLPLLAVPWRAEAQDAGELLPALSPENASAFLAPLGEALAHALAAGSVPSLSPRHGFQLTLSVGVVASDVPEASLGFRPAVPTRMTFRGVDHEDPFQALETRSPTVAGRGQGGVLRPLPGGSFEAALVEAGEDPEDYVLALPRGLALSRPRVAFLEATLGLGFGTDFVARFAPSVAWSRGLGDASVFGATLLHSLDRWVGLAASPVDLRLTGSVQRVRAGGYLEVVSSAAGLVAGARLGQIELYAHGRLEDHRARSSYRVSNPRANPGLPPDGERVDVEVASGTEARVGLGAIARLGLVGLSLEFAPATERAYALRLTLGPP